METSDPFAPIRPDQEQEIAQLLQGKGNLTRRRILDSLRGADAGQAADAIRRLKGEPAPSFAVEPPANTTDTRATIAALRERLDAGYAGRHMQPVGLNKPQGSIR